MHCTANGNCATYPRLPRCLKHFKYSLAISLQIYFCMQSCNTSDGCPALETVTTCISSLAALNGGRGRVGEQPPFCASTGASGPWMLGARSLIVHILPIADLTVVLQTFPHLPSPGHIVAHPISTCRLKGHSTSLLFDISAAQLCSVAAKSATSIVSKHVWPNQSAHEIHDCSLSTLMLSLVLSQVANRSCV